MKLCRSVIIIGGNSYWLGHDTVARIEDTSMEYSTHVDTCIDVYNDRDQLIHRIWNCPVDIEYLH